MAAGLRERRAVAATPPPPPHGEKKTSPACGRASPQHTATMVLLLLTSVSSEFDAAMRSPADRPAARAASKTLGGIEGG
jgi:hypothetical protein